MILFGYSKNTLMPLTDRHCNQRCSARYTTRRNPLRQKPFRSLRDILQGNWIQLSSNSRNELRH